MTVRNLIAYVAGPYRSLDGPRGIVENIRRAESVALELWQRGVPTLCPHKNTALFDGSAPDEVWLEGDLIMLRRCDVVLLCGDWERSTGARAEKAEAERLGIPVFEWDLGESYDEFLAWLASR